MQVNSHKKEPLCVEQCQIQSKEPRNYKEEEDTNFHDKPTYHLPIHDEFCLYKKENAPFYH